MLLITVLSYLLWGCGFAQLKKYSWDMLSIILMSEKCSLVAVKECDKIVKHIIQKYQNTCVGVKGIKIAKLSGG